MKIKMLSLSACSEGIFRPGSTRIVSDSEGAELIAGGYAVLASDSLPSTQLIENSSAPMNDVEFRDDLNIEKALEEDDIEEKAEKKGKKGKK